MYETFNRATTLIENANDMLTKTKCDEMYRLYVRYMISTMLMETVYSL